MPLNNTLELPETLLSKGGFDKMRSQNPSGHNLLESGDGAKSPSQRQRGRESIKRPQEFIDLPPDRDPGLILGNQDKGTCSWEEEGKYVFE